MKTQRRVVVIALATQLLVASAAQAADAPVPPERWKSDEAEIRQSLEASVVAFNRGDLPGHLAIYDEDVNFMTRNGPRPGIAPIEKAFREAYFHDGKPKQQLRFEQLALHPLTPDVALATARFVLSGGDAEDQTGWFTLVWVRRTAGWRAVHDHSS